MAPMRAAAVNTRPSSGTLVSATAMRSPGFTPSSSRMTAAIVLVNSSASVNDAEVASGPGPRFLYCMGLSKKMNGLSPNFAAALSTRLATVRVISTPISVFASQMAGV